MKRKLFVAIISAVVLYGAVCVGYNIDRPSTVLPAATVTKTVTVNDLWNDANNERTKLGLQPLALDARLNNSAATKCADMATRNYWKHDTPDGVEPWTFITNAGVNYVAAGENLYYGEMGTANSGDVVQDWMNSPEHRANVVNPRYTLVGYGVCNAATFNGSTNAQIVVQHFVGE